MVCPWQLFITRQLNASFHQRSTGAAVRVTDRTGLKVGGRGEGLTSDTPPQSSGSGETSVSDETVFLSGLTLIGDISYTRRQMISVWEAGRKETGTLRGRKGDRLVSWSHRSSHPRRGEEEPPEWGSIWETKPGQGWRPRVYLFSFTSNKNIMRCEGLLRFKTQCVLCSGGNSLTSEAHVCLLHMHMQTLAARACKNCDILKAIYDLLTSN